MEHVLPQAWNTFVEGEVILGRFEIVRHLGSGGMGEVYEANDYELGRIAIKTIRSHISSSRRAFERFRREVALARKVSGSQVCRIHELFLLPASGRRPATAFLTMEYLAGTPLSSKIRSNKLLPPNEVLEIALDICEGLQLIHQQGIVHRDLKPANIMLCKRGGKSRAVVMDFGLAHDQGPPDSSDPDEPTSPPPQAAETVPGAIAGTPAYMAPEQFDGKPVSAATDIYALGLILYEMLTGAPPDSVDTPLGVALKRRRRRQLPSSVRKKIPLHWDRVIQRCLEYEPSERYQSAEQVAKALKASPLSFENLRKDRPWVLRLAGFVVLALIAWGGFRWWQWRQYYRPTAEEQLWYSDGLTALREGSYLKATRQLEQATQQNSRFVMAHARLAEAWSDLDYDGKAQQEMLIATAGEPHLPPLDRMYLDAIRAKLTHDTSRALELYKEILDRLPSSAKAAGFVDLGMAYERAGDPDRALASYQESYRRDNDNVAAYMHTAVLESRFNKFKEANQAFDRAQSILTAEMDEEGLADLDFERGFAASVRGDFEQANTFLNRSLNEAKQIQSVQLEIRALTQMSIAESASGHPQEGVDLAQRAIQMSRDNGLDFWIANGLAKLGQARMLEGPEHFAEAEQAITEAKTIAVQSQHPRAEALANVALASLRDQQGRQDDIIAPSQAALAYYKPNGYFEPAAKTTLLLLRVDESRDEFEQTLPTATEFRQLAQQSGNPNLMMQAEDHLGATYLSVEKYPEALQHFQKARELAGDDTNRAFEAVSCAKVLIALGQFGEAEALLVPIEKMEPLAIGVGQARSTELLEQEKYSAVIAITSNLLSNQPEMTADDKRQFRLGRAVAEAHLHKTAQALADVKSQEVGFATEEDSDNTSGAAQQGEKLQIAEVELLIGNAQQARDDAAKAEQYFGSKGLLASDLRASLIAAAASKLIHDDAGYREFSTRAFDIQTSLEHTWDPKVVHTYLLRPDLRSLLRALPRQ